MRKEFHSESPELVLLMTDSKDVSDIETILQKGFDLSGDTHQLLPLFIEKKNLKKIMTALKLMDVRGALFTGLCPKNFPRNIEAVALKRNRLRPVSLLDGACRSFFGRRSKMLKGREIVLWGPTPLTKKMGLHIKRYCPAKINLYSTSPCTATETGLHILCGNPSIQEMKRILRRIPAGSPIWDLRIAIVHYPAISRSKILKNHEFLTDWVEAALHAWGCPAVDRSRLFRSLSHILRSSSSTTHLTSAHGGKVSPSKTPTVLCTPMSRQKGS